MDHGDAAVRLRMASSVVRTDEGDWIIKLVNILPAAAEVEIPLPEGVASGMKVKKLTLQGKAEENAARLSEETFTLGSELRQQLPAYSLTVLKITRPEE